MHFLANVNFYIASKKNKNNSSMAVSSYKNMEYQSYLIVQKMSYTTNSCKGYFVNVKLMKLTYFKIVKQMYTHTKIYTIKID